MAFKGRQPDKPGTFRVRAAKDGSGWTVSGLRLDGTRVKMRGLSQQEADETANRLWPKPKPAITWDDAPKDDWGLPIAVSDTVVSSVAQTLKIPDPTNPTPPAPIVKVDDKEEKEKKERRTKNAHSLMDMAALAGSAGVVFVGRAMCERVDKEPVKPDTKQVNDLRESLRDTLTDMFGDKEVAPWQMAILLAIGIPISMLLQSPRKKVKAEDKPQTGTLKSVP